MAWDPIRKWMDRRPLMLFAACLASGMAAGYQNAVPWYIWGAGLAAAAAAGFSLRRKVLIYSSALFLGAMLVTLALIKPAVRPQEDVLLTGTLVSEADVREEYTRVTLDSAASDGEAIPCRVMLYLYGEELPPLEYGMTVSVHSSDLYLPSDRSNPYPDSYTAYLWRQGVALCASASSKNLSVLSPPGFSLAGLSIRCRLHLQKTVDSLYPADVAPLITSLVLGDRSMLPDELYSAFKTAGLAHLLAISGLHISCLALMLDWVLRRLRCPVKPTFILVTILLTVYASVIGFPASICRAILMYVLSAGARLFGRPSDGLTGLSAALIVLLMLNPLSIADVSLILSFCSVGGIMILTRLLTPRQLTRIRGFLHSPVYWLATSLAASLAAQLGALPAIACVFGTLTTYALLSNLPALPLMTVSLPAAMLSLISGMFFPALGRLIALPVEWSLRALTFFTGWVASLPGASIETPLWPAALIFLYALILVLASPLSHIRRLFKQLIVCLLPLLAASALLLPMTFETSGLEVLFLDAGQADAAVVRAEEKYYLVDVGEDSVAADYLHKSGVRPDGIFLSHPHADHAGGLEEIIELCEPSVIYIPCLWYEVEADEGVPELLTAARQAGWRVVTLEAGDTLALSQHVSAAVHQPWPGMTEDGNGASLVISISIGESSVLFTGDLPIEDEYAMLPDCDLIKTPHHGAKGSTSSLMLKMTSPSAAVISVGHNSYGHPATETLARLKEAGVTVYRTDRHGAVSALLGPDGLIEITPINMESESEEPA